MAATQTSITAEQFAEMLSATDGAQYELIRGELVKMTPASPRHGEVCIALGALLHVFVKSRGLGRVAVNDPGVITERDPDTVRGPDVAFWSPERLSELPNKFTHVPPDLAVEVVSPRDTHREVLEKVLHFLDHGVRLVWVVDPEERIATVYRSRHEVRILGETEELRGEDVVPGFSCRVGELFE
ncbi:MAG: Uma2 family endonuclease [Pirellulales bacterium]|nr:Uma2 family endonuclease [Pirellulales bacterium]